MTLQQCSAQATAEIQTHGTSTRGFTLPGAGKEGAIRSQIRVFAHPPAPSCADAGACADSLPRWASLQAASPGCALTLRTAEGKRTSHS